MDRAQEGELSGAGRGPGDYLSRQAVCGSQPGWLPQVWKKDWVVHCKAAGSGRKVLEYLGRYVFRVAISNSRLERIQDGQVTFRYRDNHTQRSRRATLPAMEFIGRFLQHVLPPGRTKLRYYGLWSNSCGRQLEPARALLDAPPRACAAVSSSAVPRHASRVISTLLHPPRAHTRLSSRPSHVPDEKKSTPVYSPEAPNPR